MRILIGCELSGVLRRAFRAKGHDAYSCDIEPSDDNSLFHIQGDLLDVMHDEKWDMMIAHPPCTYLSSSGLHWNHRRPERERETHYAAVFFLRCWEAPIKKICLENPVGCMSTIVGKPSQYIQPYEFGDDASKKTCLWLKNLPLLPLDHSKRVAGRLVTWNGRIVERWANQCDSGQNRLGPSPDRAKKRSETYPGIALAMAQTWG